MNLTQRRREKTKNPTRSSLGTPISRLALFSLGPGFSPRLRVKLSTPTLGSTTMLFTRTVVLFLLAAASWAQPFDPAIFQSPPAEYRGHAMWRFNLTNLNESAVVNGIQE